MKPITRTEVIYPKVRIHALEAYKNDYIDLEFKKDGIYVTTCTDNCGNVFLIPYQILEGVIRK